MHSTDFSRAVLAAVGVIGFFVSLILFFRYTRLRIAAALAGWVLAVITGGIYFLFNARGTRARDFMGDVDHLVPIALSGWFIVAVSAFGIRMYRKLLDGDCTEEERQGGAVGIRAWLSPANLLVVALLTFLAWKGLYWSPVLSCALFLGILLISPALKTHIPPSTPMENPHANEREKVLEMLAAGKITAEESAELLHALGSSAVPSASAPAPMSAARRLALAGGILVLVGFFLPWFSISPGAKLQQAMNQMGGEMGMQFSEFPMANVMKSTVVRFNGGDIANGLGWLILLLGVTTAVLPFFAKQLDRGTLRNLRLLSLGIGGLLALYVLSSDVSSVSIGLVVVITGYICEGIAVRREDAPHPAAPSGAEIRA